ncbi:MAG: hypothetical protein ABIZ80_24425 [Bryobacteraceae bacterium]
MSKHKSNVNPDHYKTAGREPIGRDVIQEVQRQDFAESKAREKIDEAVMTERYAVKHAASVESSAWPQEHAPESAVTAEDGDPAEEKA